MLQLVYLSTATPGLMAQDVARILIKSRGNNRADGITGLLYHDGRRFLQALEGSDAPVERALVRTSADPRHGGVRLLSRRPIYEREFGTWTMASRPFGSIMAQEMTRLVEALARRAAPAIRDHFDTFARQAPELPPPRCPIASSAGSLTAC